MNIQCDIVAIFEKVFIRFLGVGQPVVWSEPNISQIEAWSSTIYTWYQEFEFDFFFKYLNFKQNWQKNFKKKICNTLIYNFYLKINL
jgi:hypothetical protein